MEKNLFMEVSYETSYDPSSDKINPICRQSVKMLLSSCGRAVTDSVSRLGKKWKMENVLSEGVGGLPKMFSVFLGPRGPLVLPSVGSSVPSARKIWIAYIQAYMP